MVSPCNFPVYNRQSAVEPARIAELLHPFLAASCHSASPGGSASLSPDQLESISTYIDILLRWNSRINLTAVRDPEEIVRRHFGESLFAARHLFSSGPEAGARSAPGSAQPADLVDLGSGAGFPGLPIKIWAPHLAVTLIESSRKKATFLREAIRALTLTGVNVFAGRAEDFPGRGRTVTLRAVERFENALPSASALAASPGRLALLIGEGQVASAHQLLPALHWDEPLRIPLSTRRVLLTTRP